MHMGVTIVTSDGLCRGGGQPNTQEYKHVPERVARLNSEQSASYAASSVVRKLGLCLGWKGQ